MSICFEASEDFFLRKEGIKVSVALNLCQFFSKFI